MPTNEQAALEQVLSNTKLLFKFAQVPEITAAELLAACCNCGTTVVIVDVREEEEQQVSMIHGAISSSLFDIKNHANSSNNNLMVVAYCTIGYRSSHWVKKQLALQHNSDKNSPITIQYVNLVGGILSWIIDAKQPVYHSSTLVTSQCQQQQGEAHWSKTNAVHVYGSTWNVSIKGYTTVTFSTLTSISKGIKSFFAK